MTFPVFKVLTVHFVLQGMGHLAVGDAEPLSFSPSSVLVVPVMQPHWVGDAEPSACVGSAADKCELIGDGLVEFTAGDGSADTLLLCAAVSALHDAALGLFDLLRRARSILVRWVDDYNTERPHSSLGYATPAAFAAGPGHKGRG